MPSHHLKFSLLPTHKIPLSESEKCYFLPYFHCILKNQFRNYIFTEKDFKPFMRYEDWSQEMFLVTKTNRNVY